MASIQQISHLSSQNAVSIPELTHPEAMVMSSEQLRRFQQLIESLAAEDWDLPTECTLWTVKDIVAHQSAHVKGFTSIRAFLDQQNPIRMFPYFRKGMGFLDAWNQSEVDRRRSLTPSRLIAEIQTHTERSLRGKDALPEFLRRITMAAPGLDQPRSVGYVFDLIYTRDMWMHHIDICRATGRPIHLDNGHDARTVALIVRDLAEKAKNGLRGQSILLELTGEAGGSFMIGADVAPTATIRTDVISFSVLVSGRTTASKLLASGNVSTTGDQAFAADALHFCENRVLF